MDPKLPLPAPPVLHTQAHPGPCTAACYPTYNPDDLSYAVVRNGAVQKHHTGPHAHEMARHQARQMREWADYMGEAEQVRVAIEEFFWHRTDRQYVRTDSPVEVI